MKACSNKLKDCLIDLIEQEETSLREELQQTEPHVFSDKYRRTMEKAMQVQKRKNVRLHVLRYVAAVVAVTLLAGGILFIGSEDLRASNMGIDLLEWLEDFFTVEDGNRKRKEREVLFEESQIGYLPEGFEKSGELITYANVNYQYIKEEFFVQINVYRSKFEIAVDNDEIRREIYISENGFEYTYIEKSDAEGDMIVWQDENGIYYWIMSDIGEDELLKIMNNISY